MTSRFIISKDSVQKRSELLQNRRKKIFIGLAVFASVIAFSIVFNFVKGRISIAKVERTAEENVNLENQITDKWNMVLDRCGMPVRADNGQSRKDGETWVSVFLRYPREDLKDWANSKGSEETDCFTQSIFGVKLSERVNLEKDVPQSSESLYLDENLYNKGTGDEKAQGLWASISDNSFSSSFSSDEIILIFNWNLPAN